MQYHTNPERIEYVVRGSNYHMFEELEAGVREVELP